MGNLEWWGYLHTNGHIQAKRYFDPRDIEDANESPFCQEVVLPFDANSREEALEKISNKLIEKGYKRDEANNIG